MDIRLIAQILRTRRRLRAHERWTRSELAAAQAAGGRLKISRDLREAGAIPPPIRIELVDTVTRTALGKAPLVIAKPAA